MCESGCPTNPDDWGRDRCLLRRGWAAWRISAFPEYNNNITKGGDQELGHKLVQQCRCRQGCMSIRGCPWLRSASWQVVVSEGGRRLSAARAFSRVARGGRMHGKSADVYFGPSNRARTALSPAPTPSRKPLTRDLTSRFERHLSQGFARHEGVSAGVHNHRCSSDPSDRKSADAER